MTMKVYRRGATGRQLGKALGEAGINIEYGALKVIFFEPKGYGDSRFVINIAPESFSSLAEAMMRSNSGEAIKAFGAALQSGVREEKDEFWYPGISDAAA